MRRVLHIASHLDVRMGGSILAAFEIARTLHGQEFQCEVAGTVKPGADTAAYFSREYPELRQHVFSMCFPTRVFWSRDFRDWIIREAARYDLIHVHGIFNYPYYVATSAAIRAGVRLILSPHNSLDPFDLRKKAWLKRYWVGPTVVRRMLEGATAVHCCTDLEAQRLETYGANPRPWSGTIALPVPVIPEHVAPSAWRADHQVSPDEVVVLFLARFDPKKGLDLLVRALAKASGKGLPVVLAIAGGGDDALERSIKELVKQLGLESRVRWLGFLTGERRLDAYRACDVFALPSRNENFGMVVPEALYAGKPVLVTDGVYLHPFVTREQCGLVCSPSVDGVSEALERLVREPDLRAHLSARARDAAIAEFAPENVRNRLHAFYRRVLDEGDSSPDSKDS